jgi:hypothetical protein
LINKIENVQSEAARIVTGGTKLTSIQKLYEETGWEKLCARHLLFWVLISSLKIFRDLEFRVSIGSLFHNLMDDGRK